ncbi:MAG: AraC family transcriptional regulator [Desulfobacterales bacterium]
MRNLINKEETGNVRQEETAMGKQTVTQEFEDKRMEAVLGVLGKTIARWTDKGDLSETAVQGLSLHQRHEPTEPISIMYEPRICVIAQGAKRVLLGDDTYVYDEQHFLISSVDLPTVVQIVRASSEKPYLGLVLRIDQREMSQLMTDSNLPQHACAAVRPGRWRPERSDSADACDFNDPDRSAG